MVRIEGRLLPLSDVPGEWFGHLDQLSAAMPDWAGLGPGPLVMGILNVTPDSFSDGGDHLDPSSAIAAGERMLAAGVSIIDVGGESTRPGSQPVVPDLEQSRVLPVVSALARQGATLSIDSRNAATMARALDQGVTIVNDVSALSYDPAALKLVADRGCPVILMHMRGTPNTMAGLTTYHDVALDVTSELEARVCIAEAAGIHREKIALDPGFGFAKNVTQNVELLSRLPALLQIGRPIVIGVSRKSTLGKLSGEVDLKALGPGSIAAALFALSRSACVLRVHDVTETLQAVRVWRELSSM